MLSENALAGALGMSRTPVRAALLRLAEEGWVTIYPKRGALVRAFVKVGGNGLLLLDFCDRLRSQEEVVA